MAPGESSRLATTWTAAGAGSSLSAAMIVVGTPMPVMPQAPMRPRATSCSKAGRTASTIAGCHIETGDACLPGRTHGRHRLLAGGGTPDLTNAATAEGGDFCTTPRTGALGGVGEFRREQDLS